MINNKYIQLVISFFKKLFSSSGDVGTKRVLIFLFAITAITAVGVAMKYGAAHTIPHWMFLELLLAILTLCGYNTYLTSKSLNVKSDVASDIVDKEPSTDTTEAVKDIIQADKPS